MLWFYAGEILEVKGKKKKKKKKGVVLPVYIAVFTLSVLING